MARLGRSGWKMNKRRSLGRFFSLTLRSGLGPRFSPSSRCSAEMLHADIRTGRAHASTAWVPRCDCVRDRVCRQRPVGLFIRWARQLGCASVVVGGPLGLSRGPEVESKLFYILGM